MSNTTLFRIRTLYVPDNLAHKSRAEEIKELPNYLSVQLNAPDNTGLIVKGNNSPAIEAGSYPWIRTNEDGSPDAMLIKYLGAWVDALPFKLNSSVSNMQTVFSSGFVEASITAVADTLYSVPVIFTTPFIAGTTPTVILVRRYTSIPADDVFGHATTYDVSYLVSATSTGFSVYYKTPYDGSSTVKKWAFSWVAFGQLEV